MKKPSLPDTTRPLLRAAFFVFAILLGGAVARGQTAQNPALDEPDKNCGSNQACICKTNAKVAVDSHCKDEPPNPLVDKEHGKQIDATESLLDKGNTGAKETCTKLSETNVASIQLLEQIQGLCKKRIDKSNAACPLMPEGPEKAEAVKNWDRAKAMYANLSTKTAHLEDLEKKNAACNKDVSNEGDDSKQKDDEKKDEQANKDGGGGMPQLPQFPSGEKKKNPCAEDSSSAECQKFVAQDCTNPEVYAKFEMVCKCYSGAGASPDPSCNRAQTASEPDVPADNSGGGGGPASDGGATPRRETKGANKAPSASGGAGLAAGGGGGGGGGLGGANKPELSEADEPSKVSTNILGGGSGGGGGAAAGGNGKGTYSDDGNWIPPGMQGRAPGSVAKAGPRDPCNPQGQPPRNNFDQVHWAHICQMHLEPR